MGKPVEFMKAHGIAEDEIWEVRTGRGAWAIKHSALERVAAEKQITFDIPHFAEKDGAAGIVAMLVVGHRGERSEWSVGEAAPNNNKNAYPYAMAEKRAKDRVIIKLLGSTNGATLYSDVEADDFVQKRQNPHVTRPEDIVPEVEYDEHGEPIDNIPRGDPSIEQLPKAKLRADYEACERQMLATVSSQVLEKWGRANADRIASYPNDWQAIMRGRYTEHMNDLRASSKAAQ